MHDAKDDEGNGTVLRIFLCGDVMTGRGIDQALPHPGDPVLYESSVRDARVYVRLAERRSGPIPRPLDFDYIWSDALLELARAGADARVINLETAVTNRGVPWSGKAVCYRMHPQNIGCLTVAGIDCCCLANNHVLDWGYDGLVETLEVLDGAGLRHAGAGRTAAEAATPAVVEVPGKGRILVFAFGSPGSGIPREWAATRDRGGVNFLEDLTDESAGRIARDINESKQPGDVVIVSVHWGGNWGYEIGKARVRFAHRLIEHGVHVVHGHSSHHIQAQELYRHGLILYGCGDFLSDYEGIGGHEAYRGDLSAMYLATVARHRGQLTRAQLIPMQMRRFRLSRPSPADAAWLRDLLDRLGAAFDTNVLLQDDGSLLLKGAARS